MTFTIYRQLNIKGYSLALLLLFVGLSIGFAQPANDDCANAELLVVTGQNNGYCNDQFGRLRTGSGADASQYATQEAGDPIASCFSAADYSPGDYNTVWYRFTAPVTGNLHLQVISTGTIRPISAVFSGTCGAFTEIACGQPSATTPAATSYVLNGLTPGNTYYVLVDGRSNDRGGFNICARELPVRAPADETSNADCARGTYLCTLDAFTMPATNNDEIGLQNEALGNCGETEGTGAFTNVDWYRFKATTNGVLNFTITPSDGASNFDWAVYEMPANLDCNNKTTLACNDSRCNGNNGVTGLGCNAPGCRTGLFGRDPSPCNNAVNIVAGREYAIQVKWKCQPTLILFCFGNNGYTMDFSGSTFEIEDVPLNDNRSNGAPNVADRVVDFTTSIQCGSVTINHNMDDDWQFAWKTDETTLPNASSVVTPNFNFSTAGNHIINVSVKDFPGKCSGFAQEIVNVPNPAFINIDSPDTILCEGSSTLIKTSTNAALPSSGNQVFDDNSRYAIPDAGVDGFWDGQTGSYASVPISVDCINPGNWNLNGIRVAGDHRFPSSDLQIWIVSPCGDVFELDGSPTENGTDSFDHTYTRANTTSTVEAYTAAEWDAWLAACADPNGIWEVRVGDDFSSDAGEVTYVELDFSNGQPPIQWTPAIGVSDVNVLNPTITPDTTRIYTLTVYDCASGCYVSDQIELEVVYQNNVSAIYPLESCGESAFQVEGIDGEPRAAGLAYWRIIEGDGFFGNPNSRITSYFPTRTDLDNGFVRLDYYYPDPDYPTIGCDPDSTWQLHFGSDYPTINLTEPTADVPDTVEVCALDTVAISVTNEVLSTPTFTKSLLSPGITHSFTVPNNGATIATFGIPVDCAPLVTWTLDEVCMTFDGVMRISSLSFMDLTSPTGVTFRLAQEPGFGASGAELDGRYCFASVGAAYPPGGNVPGTYQVSGGTMPDNFNAGQSPNGTWTFTIRDDGNGNPGNTDISDVEMNFTGDNGMTYAWFPNNGIDPSTEFTQTLKASPDTSQTYSVLLSEYRCCDRTYDVFVKVNPIPNSPIANDTIVCSGDALRLTAIGDSALYTYNWYSSTGLNYKDTSVVERDEWVDNPAANDYRAYYTTAVLENFTKINYDTALFVTAYDSTVGCNSLMDTINITLLPKPEFSNLPLSWDSICAGTDYLKVVVCDTVGYAASGNQIVTNWYNDSTTALNIPNGVLTSNPIDLNSVPNSSGQDSTAKIALYPSIEKYIGEFCSGDTSDLYVTVKPIPNIDSIRPASQFVCFDDTIAAPRFFYNAQGYDQANGDSLIHYDWYRSNDLITGNGRSGGQNDTVFDALPGREGFVNTDVNDQSTIITIIPERLGCIGLDATTQIDMAAKPEFGVFDDTLTVCSNTLDTVYLSRILAVDFDSVEVEWSIPAGIDDFEYVGVDTTLYDPNSAGTSNDWMVIKFPFSYHNNNGAQDTIRYEAVSWHRGCTDTTNFIVVVNPVPVSLVSNYIPQLCGDVEDSVHIDYPGLTDGAVDSVRYEAFAPATVIRSYPFGVNTLLYNDAVNPDTTINFNLYSENEVNDTVIYKLTSVKYDELCRYVDTFRVVINPQPVVDSLVYPDSICSNTPFQLIMYSRTAGVDSVQYIYDGGEVSWSQIGDTLLITDNGIDNYADTLDITLDNPGSADSIITIRVVSYLGGNACTDAATATIKVHPTPVAEPALADLGVCSDYIDTVKVTNRVPVTDSLNISIIGSLAPMTGYPTEATLGKGEIDFVISLINPTASVRQVDYEVISHYKGCLSRDTFQVTVQTFPEIDDKPKFRDTVLCNRDDFDLVIDAANGLTFDSAKVIIQNNPDVDGTGEILKINSAQTYTFDLDLDNTSTTNQDVIIDVISYLGPDRCTDSTSFTITVKPEPKYLLSDTNICSGIPLNIDVVTQPVDADSIIFNVNATGFIESNSRTAYFPTGPSTIISTTLTRFDNTSTVIRNSNSTVSVWKDGCEYAQNIRISVYPIPEFSTPLSDIVLCGDEEQVVSIGTTMLSDSIYVYRTQNEANITGALGDTIYPPLAQEYGVLLYNAFTDTLSEMFTVVNHKNGCVLDSTFEVFVKPDPAIRASIQDTTIFVCGELAEQLTVSTRVPSDSLKLYTDFAQSTLSIDSGRVITTGSPENVTLVGTTTFDFNLYNSGGANDTLDYTLVSYSNGACDDTVTFRVVVSADPIIDTVVFDRVCGNEVHTVNFSVNTSTDSIQVFTVFSPNITGSPENVTLGSGVTSLNIDLYNDATDNEVVVYNVIAYHDGCFNSTTFHDTIKPQPVIDPIFDQVICSEDTFRLNVDTRTDVVALTDSIRVYRNTPANISANFVDTTLVSGADTLDVTLANNTPADVDVDVLYTVISYKDNCTDTTTFTVRVRPTVSLSGQINQGALTDVDRVCSESNFDMVFTPTNNSATIDVFYNWINRNPRTTINKDPSLTTTGTGAANSFDYFGYSFALDSQFYDTLQIVYNATYLGCKGPDSLITLIVKPKPVAYFSVGSPICISEDAKVVDSSLVFNDDKGNATYLWDYGPNLVGTTPAPPDTTYVTWDSNISGDRDVSLFVTYDGCTSDQGTFTVVREPEIQLDMVTDTVFCMENGIPFTVNIEGANPSNNGPISTWSIVSFPKSNPGVVADINLDSTTYTVQDTGVYVLNYFYEAGQCQGTEDLTIYFKPKPNMDLVSETILRCHEETMPTRAMLDNTYGMIPGAYTGTHPRAGTGYPELTMNYYTLHAVPGEHSVLGLDSAQSFPVNYTSGNLITSTGTSNQFIDGLGEPRIDTTYVFAYSSLNGCNSDTSILNMVVYPEVTVDYAKLDSVFCIGETSPVVDLESNVDSASIFGYRDVQVAAGHGAFADALLSPKQIDSYVAENADNTEELFANYKLVAKGYRVIGTPTGECVSDTVRFQQIILPDIASTMNQAGNVVADGDTLFLCNNTDFEVLDVNPSADDASAVVLAWETSNSSFAVPSLASDSAINQNFIPAYTINNGSKIELHGDYTLRTYFTYDFGAPNLKICPGDTHSFVVTAAPTVEFDEVASGLPITAICDTVTLDSIFLTGDKVPGSPYVPVLTWREINNSPNMPITSGADTIPAFAVRNTGVEADTLFIEVTPTYRGCPGIIDTSFVRVLPTPILTVTNDNEGICRDSSTTLITFTSSVTDPNIISTFEWYLYERDQATELQRGSGSFFSSVNTNVLEVEDTNYVVVNISAATCPGVGDTTRFILYPAPTIKAGMDDSTYCDDSAILPTVYEGIATQFSWTNSNTSTGIATSGLVDSAGVGIFEFPGFTSVNVNDTQKDTSVISVQAIYKGCPGEEDSYEVIINPTPEAFFDANVKNQQLCYEEPTLSLIPNNRVVTHPIDYEWSVRDENFAEDSAGTGFIDSFVFSNNTNEEDTAYFIFTPLIEGCPGISDTARIIFLPKPGIMVPPVDQVFCVNVGSNEIDLTDSVQGATFTWANDNPAIGLAATGSVSNSVLPSFVTTNTGLSQDTGVVVITPEYKGCLGDPVSFEIVVNPVLVADPVDEQVVCSFENTQEVVFNSPNLATPTIEWFLIDTAAGVGIIESNGVNDGIDVLPSFGTGNNLALNDSALVKYVPTMNATTGKCVGDTMTFKFVVKPTPQVDKIDDIRVCEGDSIIVEFSKLADSTLIVWNNINVNTGIGSTGTGDIRVRSTTVSQATQLTAITVSTRSTDRGKLCAGLSETFAVRVDPTTVAGDALVNGLKEDNLCINSDIALTLTGNIGDEIIWMRRPVGGTFSEIDRNVVAVDDVATQDYEYVAQVTSPICPAEFTDTLLVTVTDSTVSGAITASSLDICDTEVLTVTMAGNVGDFVWEYSQSAGETFREFAGVTPNTNPLVLNNLTENISIRARVQSGVCPGDLTNTVDVKVSNAPDASGLIVNQAEVCEGTAVELTLTTSAGELQWMRQEVGGTPGTYQDMVVTGTTVSDIPLFGASGTWRYKVVASSGVCPPVESNEVTVIVRPATVPGTLQFSPQPAPVCEDEPIDFQLSGHTGNVVGWQRSFDGVSYEDLPGTGTSITINPITATQTVKVLVQNGGVCDIEEAVVKVDVSPMSQVSTPIASKDRICLGETVTLSVVNGYVGDLQWYRLVGATRFEISGETGTTLTVTPTATSNYLVSATSGDCPEVFSTPIQVRVDELSDAGTLSIDRSVVCFGDEVELTVSGETGNVTGWFAQLTGNPLFKMNVQPSLTITDNPREDQDYFVVVKNGVCPADTATTSVDVDQRTDPGSVFPESPICEGQQSLLTLNGQRGNIERLTRQLLDGSDPEDIPFPADNILRPTADTYYELTVRNGVCPPDITTFVIEVQDSIRVGVLNTETSWYCITTDSMRLSFSGGDEEIYNIHYNHDANGYRGPVTYNGNRGAIAIADDGVGFYDFIAITSGKCETNLEYLTLGVVDHPSIDGAYVDPVQCAGLSNGSVNFSTSRGSGDYIYFWYDIDEDPEVELTRTEDIFNLPVGNYRVEIYDVQAQGCATAENFYVPEPAPQQLRRDSIQDVSCDGTPMGDLCYTASGGNTDFDRWGPYEFYWTKIDSNGVREEQDSLQNQSCAYYLVDGVYEFLFVDGRGCELETLDTIRHVVGPNPYFEIPDPDCDSLYAIVNVGENPDYSVGGESWNVDPRGLLLGLDPDTNAFMRVLEVDRITDYYYIVTRTIWNEICTNVHVDSALFRANPVVDWDFFPKKPDVLDSRVILSNFTGDRDLSYDWVLYDPIYDVTDTISNSFNTNYQFPQEDSATYAITLYGTNELGCIDSLTKPIFVNGVFRIYTPNSFSPSDNNGVNDIWKPVITGVEPTDYLLEVWDRWGKKVFMTTDPDASWDGTYGSKKLPIGTYAWRVEFKDRYTVERIIRKGSVTIFK